MKQSRKSKSMSKTYKLMVILVLVVIGILVTILSICIGSMEFVVKDSIKAVFVADDSAARLIIWNVRLPRIISGGLVGVCLALSGSILQGVMRNNLASPSTIGVTSGASFIGYLTLVAFPQYFYLLPLGSIVGAFITTMIIYFIAYEKGVSPVKMILSGLAISAIFGAFNDIIRSFFPDQLINATGFLVGSLNGVSWGNLIMILPYAVIGIIICFFLPSKMNILMLGDEMSNSLGVRTESFRFFLIALSSLLAGAAIAVAGLISFIGLVIPHIARLLVGSDYKYLFPATISLGYTMVVICDTIGRIILPVGEISVSVIIAFVGAPFFLYLLKSNSQDRR